METKYFEDQLFEKIDFAEQLLAKGDYENCQFMHCHLSNADLSHINFTDCQFTNCNISLAKLINTTLNNIVFNDCKLLGLHFDSCSEFLFTVTFNNCQLDLSSFFKRKMKNTRFQQSSLREVDFSEADLTGAIFDKCDLSGALFDHTNIEKADFRTAFNYSIDPEINQIKKAKFSATGIAGLLTKYNIEIH